MRIVNRETFLALPVGTIYWKYRPSMFTEMGIKGETLPFNDWFYKDVSPDPLDSSGSREDYEAWDRAEMHGEDIPLDWEIQGRDGLFEDDKLFAVLSSDEAVDLANRILQASRGEE